MKQLLYKAVRSKARPLSFLLSHTLYRAGLIDPNDPSTQWTLAQMGVRLTRIIRLPQGETLRVFAGDNVSEKIAPNGIYEPEIANLLLQILKPGMTFLDVGAHVGFFSILAARLVGSTGKVHAFEADPWTHDMLLENVVRNGLTQVVTNRLAVSDTVGHVTLHFALSDNVGANSIAPVEGSVRDAGTIPAVTLDAYLSERGVSEVDLIKADIEGAEYFMLKGATNLLASVKRPIIVMEVNELQLAKLDIAPRDIYHLLHSYGYQIFKLGREYTQAYKYNVVHESIYNIVACEEGLDFTKASNFSPTLR